MSFSTFSSQSVNNLRILFNIDITQLNTQWVNHGAGIWAVNADAVYDWVDASLLTGFTAQNMPQVGSALVDSEQLTEAATLLECSNNTGTFYWDGETLYIHISDASSPYIHTINIGVVYGYSREGFTPIGSTIPYDSRLIGVPSITQQRDPLFFGKIQFDGGSVTLNNGDGGLDTIGEDNNAYGNQARVTAGFEELDISEYERLFTGFVETLEIDEENVGISFKDRRKNLTKKYQYACIAKNALEAIEELLELSYGIEYNGLYYNTTEWETAKPSAESVTIDQQTAESVIETIESICNSTFGLFVVDPDGKYSFKIVRPGNASIWAIPEYDIINMPRATYDPSEIISSTKIGYAKDWATTGSAYTYLTDTSKEADIFQAYKTYNEKTFDTLLPDLAAAQRYSDIILAHSGEIRPRFSIEVPIKYYAIQVGDFADVEINRPNTRWFGERKCEVIGKSWNLDRGTLTLTVRKYGDEIAYRETTDEYARVTTDGYLRKVGA